VSPPLRISDVEFDRAEEGDVELLRGALGAPTGEDVDFVVAVRAGEVAHVLNDAEDFDIDLVEHFEGLARILQGDVGWGGDDNSAGERHGLHEGDDDVAGAGREVDEEDVEVAPFHLLQKLADDLVKHGAAHDEGLVAGEMNPTEMTLTPWARLGSIWLLARMRGLRSAHHERDVGAVDVGVDEADAMAELSERDGEVDGEGGFADAALAGSDGNDGFDSGKRGGGRRGWVVSHGFRVNAGSRQQATGNRRA
jgi:hypothetical protein